MVMAEENNVTIEEAMKDLDKIIEKMQAQDISLQDSFNLYKEGLSLVEQCNNKIEKIRCDIQILNSGVQI